MSNNFRTAVHQTQSVSNCYQNGLAAMGGYRNKVQLSGACQGSVDIDECLQPIEPNAHRWDYVVGFNSEAYFIEVHSAYTSEVSVVLSKLQWLKDWLVHQAPALNAIKSKKHPFTWIASGKNAILRSSPQYRRIANAGLIPKSRLILN